MKLLKIVLAMSVFAFVFGCASNKPAPVAETTMTVASDVGTAKKGKVKKYKDKLGEASTEGDTAK